MTEPRHTHPVTPLVTMVRAAPVLIIGIFVTGGGEATHFLGGLGTGGLILLILIGVGVYAFFSWTRLTFFYDDDGDLRINSGVFVRNERRVQLSRLQSVDVTQPILARLFGLAELRPEVAGASSEGTKLQYLALEDAQQLRAELLARASGLRQEEGVPVATAPEQVLVQVPSPHLLASLVLQPSTVFLLLLIPTVVAVAGVAGLWELGITGIFLVFAPVTVVGGQFLKYFGFTVAQSPDGLRLRFGLTSHRSQTVPPGRVQAVRIERPLMWKPWGWVRVIVNVAGATGGEEGEDRPSVILPVAPLPVARALLQQVLPGVDPFSVVLTSAPAAARWRAPLQHKQLAVGATSTVFVTRRGWLVPKWDVVPHARTQSVRLRQGPWQRRLGLASVFVDSTPGPVSIAALYQDAGAARVLAQEQTDRAGLARRQAGPGQSESHPVGPPIAPDPGNGADLP
ncbi:MAG: PH domain-containing protein [Actinomycetia bacterium]|nr:PH domain-containing protein [Actinomycetes bacterium]